MNAIADPQPGFKPSQMGPPPLGWRGHHQGTSMRASYVRAVEDLHHDFVQFREAMRNLVRSTIARCRMPAARQGMLDSQQQVGKSVRKVESVTPAWCDLRIAAKHLFQTIEPPLDLLQPLFHYIRGHAQTPDSFRLPEFTAGSYGAYPRRAGRDKPDHDLDHLEVAGCGVSAPQHVFHGAVA